MGSLYQVQKKTVVFITAVAQIHIVILESSCPLVSRQWGIVYAFVFAVNVI